MKIRAFAIITALALPTLALADEPQPPTDKPTKSPDKTTDKSTDKTDRSTDKSADRTKAAKLSDGDVKIISHVHHVNQTEIDLGKAAQRSGTASVKNYGETLERDHQSSDKDLVSFAKQHKLAVIPMDKADTDAAKQEQKEMTQKIAHLKGLKGAEFDREFLNMMVTDHEKEISRIDMSISSANDPDLQTMLKSVKPVLQRHADQARDLQKSPQASNMPSDKSMDKSMDKSNDKTDKLPSQR